MTTITGRTGLILTTATLLLAVCMPTVQNAEKQPYQPYIPEDQQFPAWRRFAAGGWPGRRVRRGEYRMAW